MSDKMTPREKKIMEQLPMPKEDPPSIDTHDEELESEINSTRYDLVPDIKIRYSTADHTEREAKLKFMIRCQRDYRYLNHYETGRFWVFEGILRR